MIKLKRFRQKRKKATNTNSYVETVYSTSASLALLLVIVLRGYLNARKENREVRKAN